MTRVISVLCASLMALSVSGTAFADPIPAAAQGQVDSYKKKLGEWGSNPQVVAAVREANSKGGMLPGMSNGKWEELSEKDPSVMAFQTSPAGKQVSKWEEDKALGKVFVRDEKGNLVAASNKPLLFNNATRQAFQNGIKAAWADNQVKPDPTTQKKSVQLSAPVLDGGKAIGVIHASLEIQ